MSREQLQIRVHCKEEDSLENDEAWEFSFRLLLGDAFGEYLSGQVEKEKRPGSRGELSDNSSVVASRYTG